jgi:hypothetical protein
VAARELEGPQRAELEQILARSEWFVNRDTLDNIVGTLRRDNSFAAAINIGGDIEKDIFELARSCTRASRGWHALFDVLISLDAPADLIGALGDKIQQLLSMGVSWNDLARLKRIFRDTIEPVPDERAEIAFGQLDIVAANPRS